MKTDIYYEALTRFMEERVDLPWPWDNYTRGISRLLGEYTGSDEDRKRTKSYFHDKTPMIVAHYLEDIQEENGLL